MKKYSKFTVYLPWFICSLGALFYAYEYFLRITPSVMTEELARYYHINDTQLGSLSAFYYYIYTPMQICVGVLMDRYGPRRLLTIATICCVVGSYLFAATPDFLIANVGRFLVGLGSAFAFVGVLKLATIWLPRRYFALFAGLATALGMLGAVCGDLFMAFLVDHIGWQETVYLSASVGIILAIMIGLFVRDQSLERRKHGGEIVAPQENNIRSTLAGLVKIVKSPQMWLVGAIGGLLYIPTSAFAELWGIPYLQQVHHFSREQAAFAISMIYWGWVLGGPLAGWFSDTFRRRVQPMVLGPIVATALILVILFVPGLTLWQDAVLLFIFGVFSAAQILVFALGRELNPPQFSGTAIAFVNMVVMLSGVFFQPLIGAVLDHLWSGKMVNGVEVFTTSDYRIALMIMPLGLIISAFLARFFLTETYCKPMHRSDDDLENDEDLEANAQVREQLNPV